MLYAVLRLRGERMVVALVEQWQLGRRYAPGLLQGLQAHFQLRAMLVARDDASWRNARASAQFDAELHLCSLLAIEDIDWAPVSWADGADAFRVERA